MKLPKKIRDLLKDGQARTAKEIYTALGTDPIKTAESANNQAKRGILLMDQSSYPGRYSIGRHIPDKLSKDELRERENARKRAARLKKGARPLAKLKAERAEATRLRVLAKVAKPVNAQVKEPKKPKSFSITPRALQMTEAAPVRESRPCTQAFIEANPDKVFRLPAGVWSTPLRIEM